MDSDPGKLLGGKCFGMASITNIKVMNKTNPILAIISIINLFELNRREKTHFSLGMSSQFKKKLIKG